jgi:hypothetical protein
MIRYFHSGLRTAPTIQGSQVARLPIHFVVARSKIITEYDNQCKANNYDKKIYGVDNYILKLYSSGIKILPIKTPSHFQTKYFTRYDGNLIGLSCLDA